MAICSQSNLWNSKILWDGHVHLKAIDRDVSGTDAPCPVCAPSNQLLRQGLMQANSGVGELQLQRIVGVGRITRCVPRPPVERHISPLGRTHTLTPAITIPPDHIGLHHDQQPHWSPSWPHRSPSWPYWSPSRPWPHLPSSEPSWTSWPHWPPSFW